MAIHQIKKSMLCPNCRRLINRNEKKCPYCGTVRPGSWWKGLGLVKALSGQQDIIKIIITVNIVMFIISLLLNPARTGFSMNPFEFLSPSNRSLILLGSTGTVSVLQMGRWWTLVAANYLHGSLVHIIFNMIVLRQLGSLVIREYGVSRMLAIYTLGGVGGFVLSYLAGVRFTVGASAAICSLIGAMLYYGKSRGGEYGKNIYSQIGGWAISIFIIGLIIPGINNWGHGGGMAAGVLLGHFLGYTERDKETTIHKYLGIFCVAGTALILAWAIVSTFIFMYLASHR